MRFFWDVSSGNLVVGQGNRTPVQLFEFKRGDTRLDELIFLNEAGGQYDPGNVLVKFGVKLPGAANFLVSTAAFSKTGTGSSAVFTFAPSFQTTELNTALNIGGTGSELAFVDGDLEFEYSIGGALVSSKTFPCRIYRDINRGGEGVPTDATPPYPLPDELELLVNKNQPLGYAGLDSEGKISSEQLPASPGGGGSTTDAIGLAVSDETSDLETGTAVLTLRVPYEIDLTEIRASVNTAPDGDDIEIDVKRGGVSLFSTLLTIDDGEKTSTTAAVPAVLGTTELDDDDELTVDITQVGSVAAGKGLKIWLIGDRS